MDGQHRNVPIDNGQGGHQPQREFALQRQNLAWGRGWNRQTVGGGVIQIAVGNVEFEPGVGPSHVPGDLQRTGRVNQSRPEAESKSTQAQSQQKLERQPIRSRLPDERRAITHKFDISGHEGYITAGMYEDDSLGEIFITMAKKGSVISGLMDSFATSISIALQHGVPLEILVRKFSHTRFEPAGVTRNPKIPIAKSVMDYIFRWLELKFLEVGVDEKGNSSDPTE